MHDKFLSVHIMYLYFILIYMLCSVSFVVDMYVNDVVNGNYDVTAEPRILKETPGTAFVDGGNGIGMVGF